MAKARILLVEDNEVQADIIRSYLLNSGFEVTLSRDGMTAFKVAKTEKIDLILLDRILPDIEGTDVCRWLKLDPATRDVPIIMLTAKDTVTDKVMGLESGADDYLPKPFDENELSARIYVRLRAKSHQDELQMKNRRLEDMLTHVENLAIMDPLTGLYNRRRFEAILTNEFKRCQRYQNPLSVLMIDVDHFKSINDELGHQGGDAVLREIARLIQGSIREVDTAARWGGEEFIVVSPSTSKENAHLVARRILNSISSHSFESLNKRQVTVSIGIAAMPDASLNSHDKLVHAADLAMYAAKKNGRNRIESA